MSACRRRSLDAGRAREIVRRGATAFVGMANELADLAARERRAEAGDASPPWMREAIQTLARAIPNARHRTLEGQTHAVDLEMLAAALEEFFGE